MKRKLIRYTVIVAVTGLVLYNSIYIKTLDQAKDATGKFDAVDFTTRLWREQLPAKMETAIELPLLLSLIRTNPQQAFEAHTRSMAIGNYRYGLVKVTGSVSEVTEDDVKLLVDTGGATIPVTVVTEFIYGNAIRDASGLVHLKDFTNTTDLNNISEVLNGLARNEVVKPFRAQVKKGTKVTITAAVQFHKEHTRAAETELIPVKIQIIS